MSGNQVRNITLLKKGKNVPKCKLLISALFFSCAAFSAQAGNVELLSAAYQAVNDESLANVSAGQFAKWSLTGLSDLDKSLLIVDDDKRITVYRKSQLYKSFTVPQDEHDALAWAKFSERIIKDLRKYSPRVKQKDIEAADRMLMAGVKKLDKYSRYYSNLLQEETHPYSFSRDYAERRLDGGILYIKIGAFTKYTKANVKQSLETNPDIKALIIDLRMSPGGMLSEAIAVTELFLDDGIVVSTKGRKEDSAVFYRVRGENVLNGVPIVILVDGGTASAAEVFAAALKEQGLAMVIGTQTQGKGTVQNFVELPDDNKMLITNAFSYTPSGEAIDGVGIKPDVCLYRAKANQNIQQRLLQEEPAECPREDREDAKIDIDFALALLTDVQNPS